ncbi:MAG: hypothetical protein ABIH00_06660 [Armatimonadota bacterium]
MKVLLVFLIAAVFLISAVFAGSTDTQTIYYEVDPINNFHFLTDITLTVNIASAGSEPSTDSTISTYNLTTNETAKKITAVINANMPDYTYLSVKLDAPTGAASLGEVTLNTGVQDLVTGINTIAEPDINYSLTLMAQVAAGLPADGLRVITFTLTDES